MKTVVIGSSNMDLISVVERMPRPGETVGGARFMQAFGGKGANQAVAAARLGGDVVLVAALGDDLSGRAMLEHFASEEIDVSHIFTDPDKATGTALILVDQSGENSIAVAPGANYSLTPEVLKSRESVLLGAGMLVLQAEIPYATIREAAFAAQRRGVPVLLNPAPACRIDSDLMSAIDILVVNRSEASLVSGLSLDEYPLEKVAERLHQAGARQIVITLGRQGCYLYRASGSLTIPAFRVETVDTTAAGDVFCGALAVEAHGAEITAETLRFASAASALSVMRRGAQPSIPNRSEVEEFLVKNRNF
ncbi:ribokinase [Alistipes sp. An116]|uniref:ribokinase n=1 Tax=Alistipes sp. An116 TaxID=1965546 RepID=UPI000B394D19|nr:ribokinase [Alistipes sp. An116]OUQ51278.1 ribokinase [Alistipes sp. An116]